jgi:hypothetical protein
MHALSDHARNLFGVGRKRFTTSDRPNWSCIFASINSQTAWGRDFDDTPWSIVIYFFPRTSSRASSSKVSPATR